MGDDSQNQRWQPVWKNWHVAGVAFLALLVGFASGSAGRVEKSALVAAERRADRADGLAAERSEKMDADLRAMRSDRDRARQDAKTADARARTKAEADVVAANAETKAGMDARAAELEQQAAAIAAREKKVTATEVARKAREFGDGTHEVGVDIQPGKYKTEPSGTCYWAKLDRSGEIIANELSQGPQLVVIEPGVFSFKSERCGTWVKTG